MSLRSAVSAGCISSHSAESSQETIDTPPGTLTPIRCATPSPAAAITSLSYRIAVGGSAEPSSPTVASAPCSAV